MRKMVSVLQSEQEVELLTVLSPAEFPVLLLATESEVQEMEWFPDSYLEPEPRWAALEDR